MTTIVEKWVTHSIYDHTFLFYDHNFQIIINPLTNNVPSSSRNQSIDLHCKLVSIWSGTLLVNWLTCLESLSTCKISEWSTPSFLRYSCFKNCAIWLAESISDSFNDHFCLPLIYIRMWKIILTEPIAFDWQAAFWTMSD